jgi:hypothetical protein
MPKTPPMYVSGHDSPDDRDIRDVEHMSRTMELHRKAGAQPLCTDLKALGLLNEAARLKANAPQKPLRPATINSGVQASMDASP